MFELEPIIHDVPTVLVLRMIPGYAFKVFVPFGASPINISLPFQVRKRRRKRNSRSRGNDGGHNFVPREEIFRSFQVRCE